MAGTKITTFLIDGTPSSPRTIVIGNWNGQAFYSTRAGINSVMERQEVQRPGVYILKSQATDNAFDERVYIGEAEEIKTRFREHIRNDKIEFEEVVFFTVSDSSLTKAHVKYLEAKLIQMAADAGSVQIENTKASNRPNLSEADISVMETFIKHIELILPIVGYSMLKSTRHTGIQENSQQVFNIKSATYKARMAIADNVYIVFKDSEANREISNSISNGWKKIREKLIREHVLLDNGGKLIFTADTSFDSASAASSIVLGRQSAGTLEWITDDGIILKEIS